MEDAPDISAFPFFIMDCEGALEDGVSILPTEVAVSKFSLKEGETAHFHYFVDPGHMPLWFALSRSRFAEFFLTCVLSEATWTSRFGDRQM